MLACLTSMLFARSLGGLSGGSKGRLTDGPSGRQRTLREGSGQTNNQSLGRLMIVLSLSLSTTPETPATMILAPKC